MKDFDVWRLYVDALDILTNQYSEPFDIKVLEVNKDSSVICKYIDTNQKDKIEKVTEVVESGTVKSMIGLINEKGIGIKTMEKCFQFVMNNRNIQTTLFDKPLISEKRTP